MDFKNMKLSDLTKEQLIDIVEVQKRNLDLQENFLINISHDLRSPVNSILSVLQCLKYLNGDNSKEIKEKTNEYRKIIKRNSLKIIKLIDNLIDTTKLEGESYNLNKTNIDIVNVVESIVDSIEVYANQKNINIIFDTNVEEFIINADLEAIDRIVMNLLSNAIKFSPLNETIEVTLNAKKDKVQISVKDNGMGIAEEEQKKIFNRFEQATNSKRIEGKGSGIGLDLVSYLVKAHGGKIELKSKLNEGSEFIVTLPVGKLNIIEEKHELMSRNKVEQLEIEFSDIYL
ncbi:MAG: HAMP domain-containing sensor histidine kinase [Bacilli bacterium]|nr:HAMP domain-containing sensor histidine kinase [Bacilli bacterium]